MKPAVLLVASLFLMAVVPAPAETVKDRKGAVLQDRAALQDDPRWNYNDVGRAFAEAGESGKPVLVVLRCIPCLACAGIDSQLLVEDAGLAPLLDQFVCVRVINTNDLDLSRFQFDYDLSFQAMVFHADGTLYARYGSWVHQKDPEENATDGFQRTLEAALEIHRGYPGNRAPLEGKQGKPVRFKTPLDMPELGERYTRELDWEGEVVRSCVHCHQIGDALRNTFRTAGKRIPDELVYPHPAPETVGLTLAQDSTAGVRAVEPGSAAAAAGFEAGDSIVELGDQTILSSADVSWVLHHAPASGEVAATVDRGGSEVALTLALADGWRQRSDISRRVGTWPMRAMALGGMVLKDLTDAERGERGLGTDTMALHAEHVGQYNEHAAAKHAGFVKGDVVVEIDGVTGRLTESELIGLLLERHRPGDKVEATALRGGERLGFELPMQ